MTLPKPSLGQHILLDLYGCPVEILRDVDALQNVLRQAAYAAHAQIIFQHFHHFGGEGGVTGVLLLAESHISIHTWTEHQFAAVDIFLCGEHAQSHIAQNVILNALQAKHHRVQAHQRGIFERVFETK